MNRLYPLKFTPVFKERIWGGNKIRDLLGLDFSPLPNCGEAWVLSGVPGSQSPVANGFLKGNELNELVEIYMDDLVGEKVFEKHPDEFPVLIKFIDANDYLSIQVHPDDEVAARRNLGNGKSEMWYILQADPGAGLFTGFSREMDRESYLRHMKEKTLKEILNREEVKSGDAFYIPAGRVHALGPGILLAEIQQTSDVTYRMYDWDRVDQQGRSRELHTDLALDAIDFHHHPSYREDVKKQENAAVTVVDSPFFTTNLNRFSRPFAKDFSSRDSFTVFICINGSADVEYQEGTISLSAGETMLIPAEMEKVLLQPSPFCEILEVYIS
ncbi:MAG: type I phosphomannose isomerase catalytic subunit [bacterium]